MNDPPVVSLNYRLVERDTNEFKDPDDLEIDTPAFKGRLSKGLLTLEPRDHFVHESDVRPFADDFVRTWEIDAGLNQGHPNFHFEFEGGQVIDRQPAAGELVLQLSDQIHLTDKASIKLTCSAYPRPPLIFHLTPEVELLWGRYSRYLEGREPLPSMAYACLTFIVRSNRKESAKHYAIDEKVLRKLGELSSTRGDTVTARKLKEEPIPLTRNESTWVEAAIKAIIGHLASAAPGKILSMTDLPPLP